MFKKYRDGNHVVYSIFGIKIKIFKPQNVKSNSQNNASIIRIVNIARTHEKTFSEFKNCNNNQEVFVLGAGPTLNYFDVCPKNNTKYMALNRSFLYDKVKFDYLFSYDKIGIENYYDAIIDYKGNNCIKFFGDLPAGREWQIPEQIRLKANARKFYTTYPITKLTFEVDIDHAPLGNFRSISLLALQFVMYTNPKKVYLVGIDCTSNGHFSGASPNAALKGTDLDKNNEILINKEYPMFKEFVETHYPETEIISVNPIGLRGMFKDVYTKSYLEANPDIKNDLGYNINIF